MPGEELESEGVPRGTGAQNQFVDDQNQHAQYRRTAEQHGVLEDLIAHFASADTREWQVLLFRRREAINLRHCNGLRSRHMGPR